MNPSPKVTNREVEITRTVAIDRAKVAREKGNAALREARALARYRGADNERTKPSVMLMDWVGDDEVTVRWETVRRDTPRAEFAPAAGLPRYRGISGRAGGVMLGVVLGSAVSIGLLALLSTGSSAAASAPAAAAVAVPQVREPVLAALPPPAPIITPLSPVTADRAVIQPHRARTLLNVDATQRVRAIVDGRPIGVTPQRISVSPGEHSVVFVHPTLGRRALSVDAVKDRVTFATVRF